MPRPEDGTPPLKILLAMSHPIRWAMLKALRNTDLTMAELSEKIQADRSTVTLRHHLQVLVSCGLVSSTKPGKGRTLHYSLEAETLKEALNNALHSLY